MQLIYNITHQQEIKKIRHLSLFYILKSFIQGDRQLLNFQSSHLQDYQCKCINIFILISQIPMFTSNYYNYMDVYQYYYGLQAQNYLYYVGQQSLGLSNSVTDKESYQAGTEEVSKQSQSQLEKKNKYMKLPQKKKIIGKILIKQKKQSSSDDEYKIKKQNIKRNLGSNIAHHYVNFLKRQDQSRNIIKKIIEMYNFKISVDEFYRIVDKLRFNNYIRLQVVNKFWRGEFKNECGDKNIELAKIFRVAAYYFMNNQCYNTIQLSKKIKKDLKLHHFAKRRQILNFLVTKL